jgi:hypothetical protein
VSWIVDLRLLVGRIRFCPDAESEVETAGQALLSWGEAPPAFLRDASRLYTASDHQLRSLEGFTAVIAVAEGQAVVLTGAGGCTSLYAAESNTAQAWSSHATAAAHLAGGRPQLEASAIPELFAAQFVGDQGTHLRDVTAVPAATRIRITPAGTEERCYWPPRERWALIPEDEAQAEAERLLLATLERRLARASGVWCAVTGGLDSTVLAVAVAELGIPLRGFTWGEPHWPEVIAADRLIGTLGGDHVQLAPVWQDDSEALRSIAVESRWSEGLAPATVIAPPVVPEGAETLVSGMSAEVGRAYWYQLRARNYGEPSARELKRLLDLDGRIPLATPSARMHVRTRVARWIDVAHELGHSGWRCLDVAFIEQRERRWGRGITIRSTAPLVHAFLTPEVCRALASLPLSERITDGFHRRFLEHRRPELIPPEPARQRRGMPRVARRLAARLRSRRSQGAFERWDIAPTWDERPLTRAWLADEALLHPLVVEPMGQRWAESTRSAFLADDRAATDMALRAGALVAFEDALHELRSMRRTAARPAVRL